MTMNRAIFLDRDGTLVHARHYPSRPADLILYDGIGPRLRRLHEIGFKLFVVTNQSGIARGYFTEQDLTAMHDHLSRELETLGVSVDGFYHCPHHPDGVIEHLAITCDCRKPQPGMIRRAARDHGIELEWSWFVGDILDDIQAGNTAGCATVLVDLGTESRPTSPIRRPDFVARDTPHALDIILFVEGVGPATSRDYWPSSWLINDDVAPLEPEVADAVAG
ncbi:MAG TPA: HAD family hydrolase [Thermomicrobiales bacterium]|nr:HAD family hydrolase [Thermomicrobiales bacterium]